MSEVWFMYVISPIVGGAVGWLGNAYRNKQRKEHDILENVERIISLQDAHIKKSEEALAKSERLSQRLEAKLDRKNKSIRKANSCPHTNEGDGCPVLNQEERNEQVYDCESCEHHIKSKEQ